MNSEFCEECADLGKCDKQNCPYSIEEQTELNEKAKKLPRNYEKSAEKCGNAPKKPKTVKVSDEKTALFNQILGSLNAIYGENAQIQKNNKEISVQIGEKSFKIDIVEHRKAK